MREPLKQLFPSILAGLALAAPAFADMAEPDVSFGKGGTASMPLPCPPQTCYQFLDPGRPLAVRPDGRFLLAGTSSLWGSGMPNDFVILQRLADGAPDPSFGQGGVARPRANDFHHRGSAVAVRPDGRLVAAGLRGKTPDFNGPNELVLFGLTAAGAPDPAFPNGGHAQLAYGAQGSVLAVQDLLLQANARAIVGFAGIEGSSAGQTMLVAFTANGLVDTTFGTQGFVVLSAAPYGRLSLAQDALGRLVASHSNGSITRVHVMDANGLVAGGFPVETAGLDARTVAFDPQGRIVLGGSIGPRPALRRLTAQGAVDATFGSGGTWTADDGAQVAGITVLADGRIVGTGGVGSPMAWRWLPDGAPDPAFRGSGTVVVWSAPSRAAYGMQVAAHPSGGLLLAINAGPSVQFTGFPTFDTIQAAKLGGFTYPIHEPAPYVAQLYRDFLGREADYNGLAHWSGRIDAGESRAAAAEAFMGSPEFDGVVPPIARLVFAWTNSVPAYLELDRAVRRFRTGESMVSLARSYAFLPDAQALYGGLTNEQFVDRMYALVLGRAADDHGKSYWLARLAEGMNRGDVMLSVSESAEHRALAAAEVFVTAAYAGLLRRTPEPGGFAYWVDAFERGTSGHDLLGGILASGEYRGRFTP